MKIAVEALFDSSEIENAIMVFDKDDNLFIDIIDFMNNHKSIEYVSLCIKPNYVRVIIGKYNTIKKYVRFSDIHQKSFSINLKLSQKPLFFLNDAKIYANRENCYFYGYCNGVTYQSHDITKEMINQWCEEVCNV